MVVNFPSDNELTHMMRQRTQVLTPEKFGIVGAYSREMLESSVDSTGMQAYMYDQLLIRLWTTVLSGRMVSERPTVRITAPATWRDHVKQAFNQWHNDMHDLCNGLTPAGDITTPSPWVFFLIPLFLLWPRWIRRHPVRSQDWAGDIEFTQRVLYPQIDDIPARFGMPVVYETLESPWPIDHGLPRYLDKNEVISAFMRDPLSADSSGMSGYYAPHPMKFLSWLEQHGVNPSQLVKRDAV